MPKDRKTAPSRWPRGLNRQVLMLGLVSMLADVSSEMLVPVTPLFLTAVLGASVANVGLIEGIAEATASLLKTFSGYWSDRSARRKPFIVVGYGLAAVAKPFIGFASSWPQVLAARTLDRFGKGIRGAPRDALLADSIESSERAQAFGWHRALDTTGAIIGPLLALGLMAIFHDDLRKIFFLAFLPGLFSVGVALLIKEGPKGARNVQASQLRRVPLGAGFYRFLAIWGVFCLGNSSDAFLFLRVRDLGFSVTQTILLYCVYNFVYAATSPVLGNFADRLGKKYVLGAGLLVFALVYAGFAVGGTGVFVAALFAIYGLYAAATDGVGKSLAVDLLPKQHRAYGLGVLGAVTGVLALVASLVAGHVWDTHGASWTFMIGAAAALLSGLGVLVLNSKN